MSDRPFAGYAIIAIIAIAKQQRAVRASGLPNTAKFRHILCFFWGFCDLMRPIHIIFDTLS